MAAVICAALVYGPVALTVTVTWSATEAPAVSAPMLHRPVPLA